MSKISLSPSPTGSAVYTIASPAGSTDRTLTLPDTSGTVVSKSGTYIAPSELGSGTPNATNFLRGDGSWQVISTTPTTDQVLTATAGATAGAVGTYAALAKITAGTTNAGGTIAGSNLRYSGSIAQATGSSFGATPAGTWRAMGQASPFVTVDGNNIYAFTMFLRIS